MPDFQILALIISPIDFRSTPNWNLQRDGVVVEEEPQGQRGTMVTMTVVPELTQLALLSEAPSALTFLICVISG